MQQPPRAAKVMGRAVKFIILSAVSDSLSTEGIVMSPNIISVPDFASFPAISGFMTGRFEGGSNFCRKR